MVEFKKNKNEVKRLTCGRGMNLLWVVENDVATRGLAVPVCRRERVC